MTATPGKRKRSAPADGLAAAQAIFKRHFEARFKPLPAGRRAAQVEAEKGVERATEAEDGNDAEWDGIYEPEDRAPVEIVEHIAGESRIDMSKGELRAFMSSKPPIDTAITPTPAKPGARSAKDDLAEADNLKKDLALQRLLAESHLLDSSNSLTLSGSNRHKAIDLRLRTLGAKASVLAQDKMPMSHRKGIIAKQGERERQRRKEARENGIILEAARGSAKRQREGRGDRGIGGPGVGKFSGGTLRLSKKDIANIEGSEKASRKKGGRRGRAGSRTSRR